MLVGAAPVFTVRDIAASTGFYRDALGFTVSFEYGTPIFHVCLCRDDVALHLIAASETKRLPGHGALCVLVKDVDAARRAERARRQRPEAAAGLRLRYARFRPARP